MKQLLTLCVLIFTIHLNAHESFTFNDPEDKTGTVSGRVLDAKLNEPLPYVNVIIKNATGETLTGGITLDDGSFKVAKIPEGDVVVSVQYTWGHIVI